MHWKSPQSPRKKKARMSKSKCKAMMIFSISRGLSTLIGCLKVRLSIRFIIKMFWQTSVNVWRRPDMWKNASWIHHNAPAQNALSVKRYLVKNLPVMEHPPYNPDLAPCDFFLFQKIKSALKGTRFESVDAVKANATQLLNTRWPAALLPTVKHAWSGVRIGEGTKMRGITFRLTDFFQ